MLIDRKHYPWFGITLGIFLLGCGWYTIYAMRSPMGPSGGSFPGLTFGVASSACLIFAALLGARRRFRSMRWGRATFWLRGHLWLGALCVPLAWFHGGFRHGGPLTATMMWMLYVVVVSGFLGVLLQQFMPARLTAAVPNETTPGQIGPTLEANLADAEKLVARYNVAAGFAARAEFGGGGAGGGAGGGGTTAVAKPATAASELEQLFRDTLKPYLAGRPSARADLDLKADLIAFRRRDLPPTALPVVDQLEAICRDSRRLHDERRLHRMLHGWLFVHAPLSMALLVLLIVHAVMALVWAW